VKYVVVEVKRKKRGGKDGVQKRKYVYAAAKLTL
jgi:hypothetical protein